jgi:hypothetical protein
MWGCFELKNYLSLVMTQAEYKEMENILLKRQEEVKHSKEAARKYLTEAGIMHLLVPKGTNKKNTNKKTTKP